MRESRAEYKALGLSYQRDGVGLRERVEKEFTT